MRADRLVATLLLMQARGRVTAALVAKELGVSLATARRDLEALSAAGVPVYAQQGRGGGWSLVGGARTDLTGLTSIEAKALFMLVGPAASLDPPARSALRKLVQALPGAFRADAEAAAEAVVVDSTGWGEGENERPEGVEALQDAVVSCRKISLDYENRAHQLTQRLVDPWGLIAKGQFWYLIAGTEDGQRTFRVDRISRLTVTDLPAERPSDFDLSREWDVVVGDMERRRSLLSATVIIDAHLLPVLRDQFGRNCEPVDYQDDGPVRVRITAPMALSIAEHLAGWVAPSKYSNPTPSRRN